MNKVQSRGTGTLIKMTSGYDEEVRQAVSDERRARSENLRRSWASCDAPFREDPARRVVGRVDQDHPGLTGESRGQLVPREGEFGGPQNDRLHNCTRHSHRRLVRIVCGMK